MRIIARSTLREYWQKHPDTEQPLKAWFDDAFRANWQSPSDIKEVYANASIIANNRVIFNIKGNNYRLITYIDYQAQIIFIRDVLIHADYDKENWKNDEWFKNS